MNINFLGNIEEKCEINLDWFYHFSKYNLRVYKNILEEGIKCAHLLNSNHCGKYNGPFYISLTKVSIPDNDIFLRYMSYYYLYHSFIIEGINPIRCENVSTHKEYLQYTKTEDKRRISGYSFGEYQYHYLIKNSFIKGIQYDLYKCIINCQYSEIAIIHHIENVLKLITLLEELDIDIPIYDYSRRDKIFAHKINKEKLKNYSKKFYNN